MASAARVINDRKLTSPPQLKEDPHAWHEAQCRRFGFLRTPHNCREYLLTAGRVSGLAQLTLILRIEALTYGAPEKTGRDGVKTPRPISTPWMTKAGVAKLANLKGEERRQVDNIVVDGEARRLFVCQIGAEGDERGQYRFTLTPWHWKDAPLYEPARPTRKPVASEESDGEPEAPPSIPPPEPKERVRIEPAQYEPGKRYEPIPFLVHAAHQLVWDFAKCELPVTAGAEMRSGKIVVSVSCRAPDRRIKGEPTMHCNAASAENAIENKRSAPEKHPQPGKMSIALIPEVLSGDGSDVVFEYCCTKWGKRGGDRAATKRLFNETVRYFTPAEMDLFRDGFEAWVAYYEKIGWNMVSKEITLEYFLRNKEWRYPPPKLAIGSSPRDRQHEESLQRMKQRLAREGKL